MPCGLSLHDDMQDGYASPFTGAACPFAADRADAPSNARSRVTLMEFCAQHDLSNRHCDQKPLRWLSQEVVNMMQQVLVGLQYGA